MAPDPTAAPFFPCDVRVVKSANLFEGFLDLDFGIHKHHIFLIEGAPEASTLDEPMRKEAKHCLVILLGGKEILVAPDEQRRVFWGNTSPLRVRVYLPQPVFGTPVGWIPALPGFGRPVLDVGAFLMSLRPRSFPVSEVKRILNSRVDNGAMAHG